MKKNILSILLRKTIFEIENQKSYLKYKMCLFITEFNLYFNVNKFEEIELQQQKHQNLSQMPHFPDVAFVNSNCHHQYATTPRLNNQLALFPIPRFYTCF